MARPLKADSDRRRRNAPTFDWVTLPREGRKGRAPNLPPLPVAWRTAKSSAWSAPARDYWRWLWATPQATQWDESGFSLHAALILREAMERDPLNSAKFSAELRQIEDRHGLNPKAMLTLRWRLSARPNAAAEALMERMAAADDGRVVGIGSPGVSMPRPSDRRVAWVEWAVACGAELEVVRNVREWPKAKLVDVFGGGGGGSGPPPGRRSALDRIGGG